MAGEEQKPGESAPETPSYVTKDDVAAMITGAVNRISKDLQGKQEKAFSDISEQLKALAAAKPPQGEQEQPKDKDKPDPKVAALERQVAELTQANQKAEEARSAAERKSREDGGRSALRAELAKVVRPELLDTATKLLFDAEKRISFEDDGTPLFTLKHSPVQGMKSEDTPFLLADGITHWLKSEEAKFFIPAPAPQQGSGAQRGPAQRRGPASSDPTQGVPTDPAGKARWVLEQQARRTSG